MIPYVNYTWVTEISLWETVRVEDLSPGSLPLALNAGDVPIMNYDAGGGVANTVRSAAGTATWLSMVLSSP
jgi:hypothetical protein